METQDDSLDIAHLQRVALGLESTPSQTYYLDAPNITENSASDTPEQNSSQKQPSDNRIPSSAQEASWDSPSHPPTLPKGHDTAHMVNASQSSLEQVLKRCAPGFPSGGKMSTAETVPSDTQVISQSVYDDVIRLNKEAATSAFDSNIGDHATLATLHEGESGHIDLLAAFDNGNTDAINFDQNENENGDQSSLKLGESSPLHCNPNLFPESQRFVSKTPVTAVKHGQGHCLTMVTPTASRNPLASDIESSGGIMALSQVFKATQAPSSPLVNGLNLDPLSDRPSPNLPIQGHRLATTMSSPLNNLAATFPQDLSEPRMNYITMRESQANRDQLHQRMTRSAEIIYSEDHSDGEFERDPSFVEQIRRQKMINEETAPQLAGISAPARPGSYHRRHSSNLGSPPFRRPVWQHWADGPSAPIHKNKQEETIVSQPGGTSEEETEQEEETSHPFSRSQELKSTTEEDKENCDTQPATPPAAAADAHGLLSQALALDESPPPHQRTSAGHQHSPQGDGQVDLDEISRSSQVFVVKDSQISPGRNEDENPDHDMEQWKQNQAQDVDSQKVTPSPTKPPHMPSTPPSTSQRSRVSFQLRDDRVGRPRSESTSSHGSGIEYPRNLSAEDEDVIHSSNPIVLIPKNHGGEAPRCADSTKPSSMPSQVVETPVRRIRSSGSNIFNTSIPETSPNRLQNEEEMDQEDDDLPPVYPSHHERNHHLQPASASNSSSPVKLIYNSNILSSPSGRQRRALTEIAADLSPQVGLPFDLDFNILSTADREFRSATAMSPIPPRKRRRRNIGHNAIASDPVLPVKPFSMSHLPPPQDTETRDVGEPQKDESPTRSGIRFENPTKPSRRVGSLWDLDRPHRLHASRNERLRVLSRSRLRERKVEEPRVPQPRQIIEVVAPALVETETEQRAGVAAPEELRREAAENNPSVENVVPVEDIPIAANQVFAPWSGVKRAYYPATCFGQPFGTQQSRYLVKFDDSAPVEVQMSAVKRLELRVGDAVKVDMPNVPKVTHIIRGFDNKLGTNDISKGLSIGMAPMTDVFGYSTLILGPKQRKSLPNQGLAAAESVIRVPISRIYLDTILWNRLKDRDFTYCSSVSQSESRLQTPSDRHTTPASPSTRLSRSVRYSGGLFSGMVFAVSFGENDDAKLRTTQMILDNDGRILHGGFNELFDMPSNPPLGTPTKSPASGASGLSGQLHLTSGAEEIGFACLIADRHSRRPKYMQALALNIPCLSDRWVEDCVNQGRVVDWEIYLLPAGESSYLNGATKSRILAPYPATKARLPETIAARPNLLHEQSVLIIMGRGKADEEKRKAYLFLTYALGATRVERVPDIKSARVVLDQQPRGNTSGGWDWIYVDSDETASAITTILGSGCQKSQKPRKRKRGDLPDGPGLDTNIRIVSNEFVCQSLILGKLVDQ
ncbi:hypothetical protein FE257_012716 [Aspergillus nanangensis]|uniref:BRCT domain-containing protein n=1 Tax=Aspergillus nanangensis TaxID=2582783 RepID=A0AAD4GQL9_ASPNN|nr:hypothetical protein FE257_012716 [Aspergillus nanangensis]